MDEKRSEEFKDFELKPPVLTFDSDDSIKVEEGKAASEKQSLIPAGEAKKKADPSESLSPQELKMVDAFVQQIDLRNSGAIMNYGAGTQRKMADFSEKTLSNVRSSDMGEVGRMISSLVVELKNFDGEPEKGGLLGFFHKKKNQLQTLKAQYSKVEANVTTIQNELEKRQIVLMKDSAMFDKMYELNYSYFKELTMYLVAGQKKLEEVRTTELPALQRKAAETGLPEDAQRAKDLGDLCDRFEKKLHDLSLTRTIAMQTAPQIRMVQASDNMMAEKIQSTIVNTIPLWKNQMVIALGVEHSAQAARAEREVSDMTNALLKKNAEALKSATIETARESERGIVDVETLKQTNASLISTLDEVMAIQKDGRAKREAAEGELKQIEAELKEKLLQASRN